MSNQVGIKEGERTSGVVSVVVRGGQKTRVQEDRDGGKSETNLRSGRYHRRDRGGHTH